ncbi:MAG: zinc-dependent alcohol dehydrogenase family protein [Anaerolineaceae bacterium]
MKAAVLYSAGDIRIEEKPIPTPGIDEVLIKIYACGVCGTDNALNKGEYPGNYPVVIGHEFSGEIVEIGKSVKSFSVGDRVTVDPNRVCHKCYFCRNGLEHLCDNLQSMGVHIDGADAEYCVMLESNVYKIGNSISYEEAAFCEPLACAIHGTDLAKVKIGDTVLIIGAGGMGNLITQCVKNSGASTIIVSEPIAKRRDLALENGATHVIDPLNINVLDEIKKIKPVGVDVVFEVAGISREQAACPAYARKGGTIVFFGCSPKDKFIQLNPFNINENEQKILGSFNNQFATGRAVEMLVNRKIRVDNLISHRFSLDKYLDVFRAFGTQDSVKLMVYMD